VTRVELEREFMESRNIPEHGPMPEPAAIEALQSAAHAWAGILLSDVPVTLTPEGRQTLAGILQSLLAAFDQVEQERDEAVRQIPTGPPSYPGGRLLLNAYGRAAWSEGYEAAKADRSHLIAALRALEQEMRGTMLKVDSPSAHAELRSLADRLSSLTQQEKA
jgi:hypothetical protein